MPAYTCRFVVPELPITHSVEASSPEQAAMEFHWMHDYCYTGLRYRNEYAPGKLEYIDFAKIEVSGETAAIELITRVYRRGIFRVGGVKRAVSEKTELAKFATVLGYEGAPETLLDSGWDFEESNWA